jgi:hypothetical protein
VLRISGGWILEYTKYHKDTRKSALDSRIPRILRILTLQHELQLTRWGSPMMTVQVSLVLFCPHVHYIDLAWSTLVEACGMRACEIGRLDQWQRPILNNTSIPWQGSCYVVVLRLGTLLLSSPMTQWLFDSTVPYRTYISRRKASVRVVSSSGNFAQRTSVPVRLLIRLRHFGDHLF